MPIARYIDKHKGEKDDFFLMVFGSLLVSIVPFLYLFIKTPIHLYLVQVVLGIGGSFANPGWYAIFTRHIDKEKEGTEWTLENVGVALVPLLQQRRRHYREAIWFSSLIHVCWHSFFYRFSYSDFTL